MGNIRKRSKSTWTIQQDEPQGPDGKQRQRSKAIKGTKRDAQMELARIENEIHARTHIDAGLLTVEKYLLRWLKGISTAIGGKTYERYREIIIKCIIPRLGKVRLTQLTSLEINSFLADMLVNGRKDGEGGLSRQTSLHYYAVLHKASEDAAKAKILPFNPMAAVVRPKPEPKEKRIASEDEIAGLLSGLNGTRLFMPTIVAYLTGMRRGEICALRWCNVDLEDVHLLVVESLQQTKGGLSFRPPKTRTGRRQIALSPYTVKVLRKHKAQQSGGRLLLGEAYNDNDLVFPREDENSSPPDSLTTSFRAASKRIGLEGLTFHFLRHTHATELLSRYKVHPKVVTKRLGHSDVATTLRLYAHIVPTMQRAAANELDKGMRVAKWES